MINVTKRSGKKFPIDLTRLHRVVSWACEGLTNVSESQVEINARIQFYDGIKTRDIQETLIKSAAGLITEDTPNYQYVAGRLINYDLRKIVYDNIEPKHLYDHVKYVVSEGYYDPEILNFYTEEEFNTINGFIDHRRDYNIPYVGMEQFRSKYLIRNRVTNKFYETPQMAYILIAMILFKDYPKETRLKWVHEYYDAVSNFDVSLPTPIIGGLRTTDKQFSSCTLIECGDSIDSITATTSAIINYVAKRAGIGVGVSSIRSVGSAVGNGRATHTGVIPYYKLFNAAVGSASQGGIRKGSATLTFLLWNLEIEDLLVLKNNKGTEETRIRTMDYCVQFNRVMYERLISGGNITLFSPHDVPEVYKAFFENTDKFRSLYEAAEKNSKLRKKTIPAIDLFSLFMQERKDTGRIYLMNVDNVNEQGAFIPEIAPVRMTNLCVEINLPTKTMTYKDSSSEIALCTLSAIGWGKIKAPEDFKKPCELAVRALDALLDYQDYPVEAAKSSTMNRRPLGIGIIDFAHWLAKQDIPYDNISKENLKLIHKYAEAWSYYLIRASVDLAKEKGPCPLYRETKYGQGIMPIDTYKKTVDELADPIYNLDWEGLREDLKTYGIRNSTLMAIMPGETSSLVSNSTNGIEPPRALVSVKVSKDGVFSQVVPEIRKLKNKYNLLWDQKSPEGYLKICAILQKFVDQSISVNVSYNPKFFENEEIPMSNLLKDLLFHYKYGGKTLYYHNTNDGAGEKEIKVDREEDCDTCKI